jgi:hypothetical protein
LVYVLGKSVEASKQAGVDSLTYIKETYPEIWDWVVDEASKLMVQGLETAVTTKEFLNVDWPSDV